MPLGQDDPPNLQELQVRHDEREKVLTELEQQVDVDGVRDKRVVALVITVSVALGIALPALAAIVGFSVRAFRWASGP